MTSGKCKNCGGTEIDIDPARGDAVCTNCGTVLESSAIVSEVQFEDTAHGGSSAIGQFVSSDSRGGARGFGGTFNYGLGKESREITLQNAKKAVASLGQQLRLNQHCIDTAFNFYKMALSRNLTRGRKNTLVVAACVYMTCRTEGTAHLLIDCSDVLQINVYELGRTYLRLSQALCINIPSMDPCLFILRFANRLDFGEHTHEVSMSALRLVQRMKKDSIHSGRRPSGLCGAALLMAARLHDFSRSIYDIVKIVKVHESTVRKRLLEFGETPSSCLTLDQFMTVDLEEEQDPPSFKAARLKDRERLQKLLEDEKVPNSFNELQKEIDKLLENDKPKCKRQKVSSLKDSEVEETDKFTGESIKSVIHDCFDGQDVTSPGSPTNCLGPNIASFNLVDSLDASMQTPEPSASKQANLETGELDMSGINDEEIDGYIMNEREFLYKGNLWNKINAAYLKTQKEKEEKLVKEREEGKTEKKRKRTGTKKNKNLSASTAGEAISKMLKEKKLSNKINYEVLKDLNVKDFSVDATTRQINLNAVSPSRSSSAKVNEISLARNDGNKHDMSPKNGPIHEIIPENGHANEMTTDVDLTRVNGLPKFHVNGTNGILPKINIKGNGIIPKNRIIPANGVNKLNPSIMPIENNHNIVREEINGFHVANGQTCNGNQKRIYLNGKKHTKTPIISSKPNTSPRKITTEEPLTVVEPEQDGDDLDDSEFEPMDTELSLTQMLNNHHHDEVDYVGGYGDFDYVDY